MSFEHEWAQAKATAAEKQSVSMQLNQTPDGEYHPGSLPPQRGSGHINFRAQTAKLIDSSWGMLRQRDLVFDTLDALVTELSAQKGMVGDDDAGNSFATVYKSAATTVVDQMNFASMVMSSGANALLDTAEKYLANESKTAAKLLEGSERPGMGVAPQPSRPDCTPCPNRNGEELPDVVGETGNVDRFLFHDRFRGDPGKLRKVARKWYTARGLLVDAYYGAEDCWRDANLNHEGLTADAVEQFFKRFVGKGDPPERVADSETLMANLPAACVSLGHACEAYADHIEAAAKQAVKDRDPLLGESEPIWEEPIFGGNGLDGGLHEKVAGDSRIAELGKISHALDSSKGRVRVPQPDGGSGIPGLPGWLPPLVRVPARVPVLIPAAYKPPKSNIPYKDPVAPPNPPDPRFPSLSPGEHQNFSTWLNGLRDSDFSGGSPEDKRYQYRVSGYPEKEVPLPPGWNKSSGALLVDGFRSTDGMAVEAKHVRNQDQSCYRTLESLREEHSTEKRPFLYRDDRKEMQEYAAAMNNPQNREMRGVELNTDYQDAVPYWRVMMAAYGVKGYARYTP